jgi:hypothetical protein
LQAKGRRFDPDWIHIGWLAQLVRASRLHREGRGFESLTTHNALVTELAYVWDSKS